MYDEDLSYDGRPPAVFETEPGDVVLFVSDAWHRGFPARPGGRAATSCRCTTPGANIAQRVRPTVDANQVSAEAAARARRPSANAR